MRSDLGTASRISSRAVRAVKSSVIATNKKTKLLEGTDSPVKPLKGDLRSGIDKPSAEPVSRITTADIMPPSDHEDEDDEDDEPVAKKKARARPKLTDADRHARFVETARKVEASEDPAEFERAFKTVVPQKHRSSSGK